MSHGSAGFFHDFGVWSRPFEVLADFSFTV